MPFARVIRAIAELAQQIRQQPCPGGPVSACPTSQPGQRIATDLLSVVASEDARSRRPAARGVIELGETQAAACEPIQIRSLYLASIIPGIRKSHVIGHNHQYVGPALSRRHGWCA